MPSPSSRQSGASAPPARYAEDHRRLVPRKGGGGRSGRTSGKGGKGSPKGGASAAKSHGAPDGFTKSRSGGKPISMPSSKSSAYAYSDGGGKSTILGSNSPFAGRQAGGGSRYLNDTARPGGNLATAVLQPTYNTSAVTYRLIGDNSSVTQVFDALVANCSVANSTTAIAAFLPSASVWPQPEQVVQYYRASSFALSLDGYNNTASLITYAPASNSSLPPQMADTPLPSGLNMTFLECVNATVGQSVPLVDVPAKKKLSPEAIIGIIFAGVCGIVLVYFTIKACCKCLSSLRGKVKKLLKRRKTIAMRIDPESQVLEPEDDKTPPTSAVPLNIVGSRSRPSSADAGTLVDEPIDGNNHSSSKTNTISPMPGKASSASPQPGWS
ncbi:uncharacterized protein FOMMEDRAFT_147352 [Fomitiporia mediterranea MF3/22]|uniref:uncharacterized protein n=1 Tax=Fomitiporia mediterranea (strain MF3/22) TaxID=694068 RepID=UPI000440992C|nr:uncharacterized protein FOMMEDRAFT_147352 [Fomitiporia mediterranea MF3/22]EJD02358.1 hypothetical protein FOMMEDRAFT_147352 [Fomitiporia mediterranea MF3/22]